MGDDLDFFCFRDALGAEKTVADDLAELARLVESREANVIKLPNISMPMSGPLAGMKNLRILHIYFNSTPEDQKAMLRKALPNCDIIF